MIIGAVVVALFLLLLFVWPRGNGDAITPETPESVSQALVSSNSIDASVARSQSEHNPVVADAVPPITNQDSEFEQRMRKATEAANIPVAFYGMVVDQDSNALQNVSVDLQVIEQRRDNPPTYNERRTPLQRLTGADGRFEVVGTGLRGMYVLVFLLNKDGYDQEAPGANHGAQGTSFDNPAVFMLWKTNLHEPLISGEKSFDLFSDGRRYAIDLVNGTMAEGEAGDLVLWIKRPEKVEKGQRFNWDCELAIPNGGLLESQSRAMFMAPEGGYTNLFAFQAQASLNGPGSLQDQRFYVQLRNGQMYGRIVISLYPDFSRTKSGLIQLSYAVNPSGSRLLR